MDPETHWIGERFGGGIVFYVSEDGLHGLIAETVDQGCCHWIDAHLLAQNGEHSEAGKAFTDWRLPTTEELLKLWRQREIVGGFGKYIYWISRGD